MTDEVYVTTSQSDAAKMIVERNSANGKPTPDAIRKIAEAQPEPSPEEASEPPPAPAVSRRRGWIRTFLARLSLTQTPPRGTESPPH